MARRPWPRSGVRTRLPVVFKRPTSKLNPDAADWINRVYDNGSTVSASTAAAVNTFCDAINAVSGLREKFYRLNLFCGTGLNACLVPLYRGPSLGGAQYGGTVDTNSGGAGAFINSASTSVSAYNEPTGLTNASRTAWLDTGLPTDTLAAGNRHLAFYARNWTNATYREFMGSESAAGVGSMQFALGNQDSASSVAFRYGTASAGAMQSASVGAAGVGLWLGVSGTTTSGKIYLNGTQSGSDGVQSAATPTSSVIHVFGIHRPAQALGSNVDRWGGSSGGYSIGAALSQPQAQAYYSAMQAFQTALGRNV